MIKPIVIAALWAALVPTAASAACPKKSETVFSCTSAKGKLIQVCDSAETIDYSFGNPNSKPEILVRAPRKDASTFQWRGIGRSMTYSVEIPNKDARYSVFWSVDRLSDDHAVEAGVSVSIGDKTVATIQCAAGKPIEQNIEGIDLKPIE